MALQYIGYAFAAADHAPLPVFAIGDLALVAAYRDGSNTAPSVPAGWTSLASSGADTNAMTLGYRVLQAGDTATGTWTNCTEIQALVVRGQHLTTPLGTPVAYGGANSNQPAYHSVRIFGDPIRSWVVGFAGHRTATDVSSAVATGMANRSAGATAPIYPGATLFPSDTGPSAGSVCCHTQADTFRHDTPLNEDWFDGAAFTVNATSSWRSYAFELFEATVNQTQTATAEVSLVSGLPPVTRTLHRLIVRARKTVSAHTGVIRLQLFEGVTPRTGVLSTGAMTTALTDYTINIPDADAALIGSYSDLSVRFNGYSSEGTPTVFEVDQIVLQTPPGTGLAPPPVFPNVMMLAIIEAPQGVPVGGPIYPSTTLFPSDTSP